jgi:hypothetical protein
MTEAATTATSPTLSLYKFRAKTKIIQPVPAESKTAGSLNAQT